MNARFFRLDRPKIERELQRYAESLAEDPQVLALLLFTAMSDADVVVILSDSPEPFHRRIPAFLCPGLGSAVDVFPYTLDEALQALRQGWGVVSIAMR